jgi:hypothetical protein
MALIKGKTDCDKSISAWLAARASDTIKNFIKQSDCKHDGDIIIEEYVHPHNGEEKEIRQCVKCGKIL